MKSFKKVLAIVLSGLILSSCVGCGNSIDKVVDSPGETASNVEVDIESKLLMNSDAELLQQYIDDMNVKVQADIDAFNENQIYDGESDFISSDTEYLTFSFDINGKKLFDKSVYEDADASMYSDAIASLGDLSSDTDFDFTKIKEPMMDILKTTYAQFADVGDLCEEHNMSHDKDFYERTYGDHTFVMVYGVKISELNTPDTASGELDVEPRILVVDKNSPDAYGIILSNDVPLCWLSSYSDATISDWSQITDLYTYDEYIEFTVDFVTSLMQAFSKMGKSMGDIEMQIDPVDSDLAVTDGSSDN